MPRTFTAESHLDASGLGLGLAPALTPDGLAPRPSFFHGFAVQPQVLARGLVTLADVTATRYARFAPASLRDPVLTAHGDRLRAECFSACNGVYARLDLFADGFDGGEIGRGTTNVDVGPQTRRMLSGIARNELLHLDVGTEGLVVATPDASARERPVEMPDRWVRALGNAAELHHGLTTTFTVNADAARAFLAGVPPVTGKLRSGWLTPTPGGGIRLAAGTSDGAVHISGLHRLSAAKRMLMHVTGLSVHGPAGGESGPALICVELPSARLTLALTEDLWRGYSGEGALLSSLAAPDVMDNADLISVLLAFEPVIDVPRLSRDSALPEPAVRSALAVLAASGRVGWDVNDQAWFHRELPDDPDRVDKDNPRLVAARGLVAAGAVSPDPADPLRWRVRSGGGDYLVRLDAAGLAAGTPADGAGCTCAWYLRHTGGRGPCKHVLAVQLVLEHR